MTQIKRTAVIEADTDLETSFWILLGDYSHLHGIVINSNSHYSLEEEWIDLIYKKDSCDQKRDTVDREEFREALLDPTTALIQIGYII